MNPSIEFERFTQRVYQKLLYNDILKPIDVQHNKKLKGKSGCEHQIDVYWEYMKYGTLNRVAIECKNYNSHVPLGKVRDFYGVLQDFESVRGIMVSSKGFQKGAKQFASFHGISLKELRVPNLNDFIGSISIKHQFDRRHCIYAIDEDWAIQENFDIQGYRERLAMISISKSDYWRNSIHLPINTKDRIIRDSKGKVVSSIEELEKHLPKNPEPGSSYVFPFDDGWLNSRYWGPVKIREVKFEYESSIQEKTFNIAADGFVEAILDDAISGKTDYVPKY